MGTPKKVPLILGNPYIGRNIQDWAGWAGDAYYQCNIRAILGLYRDNGKENGNYYSIIGYILGLCWGGDYLSPCMTQVHHSNVWLKMSA